MKTLKEINSKKLFTAQQLLKKYDGKFINTYPHHHSYWNEKGGKHGQGGYETVYEVRGVSATIKENYNLPQDEIC